LPLYASYLPIDFPLGLVDLRGGVTGVKSLVNIGFRQGGYIGYYLLGDFAERGSPVLDICYCQPSDKVSGLRGYPGNVTRSPIALSCFLISARVRAFFALRILTIGD